MFIFHSNGTAIDLAANKMDYWKWGHFDLMHYEYRPEIVLKARYFGNRNNSSENWYYGSPAEEEKVKEYINKIKVIIDN